MGTWYCYSTETGKYQVVNTLSLNRMGSIHIKGESYLNKDKSKAKLAKNLKKLKPGLLKT